MTSEADKNYLERPRINVIPNGVDSGYFYPDGRKKDIDLIFSGNMGYFPNEDAVCYFYKEIFSLIKERFQELKVYIVGVNPSKRVKSFSDAKHFFVTSYMICERLSISRSFAP